MDDVVKNIIEQLRTKVNTNCSKKNVSVTNAEVTDAIVAAIGGRTISVNEIADVSSVEVVNNVKINDDGTVCRVLEVSFQTIEYRIARSNWFVTSSEDSRQCLYTSKRNVYNILHPYTGTVGDHYGKDFVVGDRSVIDRNDYSIYPETKHSGDYVFSFEAQDVFRIRRNYGKKYYVVVELLGDDDRYYTPVYGRVPATVHTRRVTYYTGKPSRTWYGVVRYIEQVGDKSLATRFTVKEEVRSSYPFESRFQTTEDVTNAIIKESISFNPREISNLPSCQA